MNSLFVQGWLLILVGAISIAVGGVLATLGWKTLDSRSHLRAVISGVAREWEINDTLLRTEPLFTTGDSSILGSHCLYPRFKSSAIDAAISSGLFNPSDPNQRLALRILADSEATISDVNARLAVSDNFVLSTTDQVAIADHRVVVTKSAGMVGFMKEHTKLKELLEKQYAWALRQKFLD